MGLPHGCSGAQPQQREIRIADEVLTILAEAALENEQIGKAMEAMEAMGMDTALNLKQEENIVVARGDGSKSVQMGLAQAARQGIFAGISKTKVRYLGNRLTWNMAFAAEKENRTRATWNAWHMMGQFWKATVHFEFKCNVFKATVQGALLSGLGAFAGRNGSFKESELHQLKTCEDKLARRLLALTRKNWDTEPKNCTESWE